MEAIAAVASAGAGDRVGGVPRDSDVVMFGVVSSVNTRVDSTSTPTDGCATGVRRTVRANCSAGMGGTVGATFSGAATSASRLICALSSM